MNQKDLIKYGLLALGAYLVWKYIEDHGGLSAVLGTVTAPPQQPVVNGTPGHVDTIQPTHTPPTLQPPVLDMTGLVLHPDINQSFTGAVKINGVPTTLSVISTDGRIFDTSGAEVTGSLQAAGIDVAAIRAAFAPDYHKGSFVNGEWQTATPGTSGLGAWGFNPPWLN